MWPEFDDASPKSRMYMAFKKKKIYIYRDIPFTIYTVNLVP